MKSAQPTNSITPIHFQVTEIRYSAPPSPLKNIQEDINLKIGHAVQVNEDDRKFFTVDFILEIQNKEKSLKIHVEYRAFFISQTEITDEYLQSPFMQQSPPAIAYPYLRAFIISLTSNAGINTIILPPLNFTKVKDECAPQKVLKK